MPALLPRAIASAPSRRVAPLGTPPRLRPRPRRSRGWARPAHGAGQPRPPSSRHTSWSGSTAGLGLNSLACARSPLPRPRASATDRRGSSRRSAALSCPPAAGPPCGLRVGARAEMRYAADHREPTPPPIRAQATPSLTRTVQIRPKRRISNGACPSAPSEALFRAFSGALGPKMAPAPSFRPQNGLRRRCKAACNSPRVSRKAENSGPLAFRRPPARRGLRTAPGTVPTAQARSVLGSRLSALRGYDLSISGLFFKSPSKSTLHTQRPRRT